MPRLETTVQGRLGGGLETADVRSGTLEVDVGVSHLLLVAGGRRGRRPLNQAGVVRVGHDEYQARLGIFPMCRFFFSSSSLFVPDNN